MQPQNSIQNSKEFQPGFEEILNLNDIQKLQDQFASAFGLASIITKPDGTPITRPSNFTHLCQNIIRCTEKGLMNCMHSDSVIGRQNPNGPTIQPCLSGGLWDAGASITIGGKHVANWLIGQVRNEFQDEGEIRNYALEIGANPDDFMAAFKKIPSMPGEQFQKIAEILFTMASQISLLAFQNLQQARFIQERKIAEQELKLSEERFRTTFFSIGDGVITTDAGGRIDLMNPIAESLTGWTQQEAHGKVLEVVFDIINEQSRMPVEAPIRKVLRDGMVVGLANHTLLITKDGAEIPIADSASPIRDDQGIINGVVLVFRDKTIEHRAENKLRESEERFQMLFNKAPLGYQSLDLDGNFIEVNQQWLDTLGYAREEVIGRWFGDFLSPRYQEGFRVRFPMFKAQGSIHSEFEMVHKMGKVLFIAFEGKIGYDENGRFKQTHCILQDITDSKKAEENLRESEERFRSLFELAAVAMSMTSLDGSIKTNKTFAGILGYTQEEFSKKGWKEITHPDDIGESEEVINKLLVCAESTIQFEKRYLHKDGHIVWGDVSTSLYRDSNQNPLYFMTIINNISKRKESERLLIESEARFRKAITEAPLPIMIHAEDHEVIAISRGWTEMSGYEQADIPTTLEWTRLAYRDNQESVNSYLNGLYGIDHWVDEGEFIIHAKNGEEKIWDFGSSPLDRLPDGRHLIISMAKDITERKIADKQIRKLTKSIEQSPSTILITDIHGNIEYVNPKFTDITGYLPSEVIGKNPRVLRSGNTSENTYREMWKMLIAGEVWRGEFHNRKKNGELYWEWATITSIKDNHGTITNYIAIKEDISQRKEMEGELIVAKNKAEESDRLKSAFLANMSHEIRTPLNSIIGFSELLADLDYDGEEKQQFISQIITSGNNLLNIITDIVDISRIEAGELIIWKSKIQARSFLNEIVALNALQADKKSLPLLLEASIIKKDFDVVFMADPDRLKQVCNNLISNALKFTIKGFIELGYLVADSEIKFYVKDTGIGIPTEFHEKIFDRFRQVEASSLKIKGGNGLGLAISKNLIELMGGRIWVESQPGVGSTFFFTLPLSN